MAEMTCPLCGRKMQLHREEWTCFDCDFVWMGEGKVYPDTFEEWEVLMQPDLPRDLAKWHGKYVQRKPRLINGDIDASVLSVCTWRKCPDCGTWMRRDRDVWYCHNCGYMDYASRGKRKVSTDA